MILDEADINRFWSNVGRRGLDACWEWIRSCNKDGYGRFRLNGKMELVHRVVYTIVNGVIPELFEGLPAYICHSCDNPPCCNPQHLFLGNQRINLKDSSVKDRQSGPQLGFRGVYNYQVKVSEVQVVEIKRFLREKKSTHREIAEKYGVSRAAVTAINNGKTWSHITI